MDLTSSLSLASTDIQRKTTQKTREGTPADKGEEGETERRPEATRQMTEVK